MVLLPCSKCCGGDGGDCWSCLTSSGATWGRIIYEAGISEVNVPPELISQTFNCGIWPGLRFRFESRQTASWNSPYLGPGFWCNCGGSDAYGGASVRIEFKATNEENNGGSTDPAFQPIIAFGSDNRNCGTVPQGEFSGTACNSLVLQDGWETWQVEGFGQHEFSLNVVEPFANAVVGTVKVQLKLTDKLMVQDLSDYPSNYFPINPSDGCATSVPDERLDRTVGSCKDTEAECEDFCQEPPETRQWFQKKPCEQKYPCAVNGKRVKPGEELKIDFSELQADGWGDTSGQGDLDGFTGTVDQFNSWVSDLDFSAFSFTYPEPQPQPDSYPMVGGWSFRGCVEFWEGGPPPFDGAGKSYCERTGGNDLAGLFYTRPPDDLEICGTAEPGERPDVSGQGSFCSSIRSGCGDTGWFALIDYDFTVQQQFTDEGFCTVLLERYPPAGSEEITTVVNGMKVDITVPAAHLRGTVSACGSYQETQPDGTVVTVLRYPTAPVALSGKVTMTYQLEPWEEDTGTCCLPTGDCVENSTEPACYELCGRFIPNASEEECKNGIPGVSEPCFINDDYFYCWDFINGQPPPTWTPAGPIGTECDYENGPTVATGPTTFATTPRGRTMPTKTTGPGTELANMLKMIGINSKEKGCQCKSHAKRMDREGPQWCRDNIDTILGWLQTEAK
ncbi:MAG: hypothetical protein ACR2NF_09925, partial [Pirellulales bacterium]